MISAREDRQLRKASTSSIEHVDKDLCKDAHLCLTCGFHFRKHMLPAHQRSCIKKHVKPSTVRSSQPANQSNLYPCVSCKALIDYQSYSNHIRICGQQRPQFNTEQMMDQMMTMTLQPQFSSQQHHAEQVDETSFFNNQYDLETAEEVPEEIVSLPPQPTKFKPKKVSQPQRPLQSRIVQETEEEEFPESSYIPKSAIGSTVDDRIQCSICGRKFNSDAMERHQKACEKLNSRPRKVFDSAKIRAQGTALEAYQRNRSYVKNIEKKQQKSSKARDPTYDDEIIPTLKVDPNASTPKWKVKHEQFIRNIRMAKSSQTGPAGRMSGNSGPREDPPDIERCLHCNRPFHKDSIDRHRKVCEDMKLRQSFKRVDAKAAAKMDALKRRIQFKPPSVTRKSETDLIDEDEKMERHRLSAVKQKQHKSCIDCGADMKAKARFCMDCGSAN